MNFGAFLGYILNHLKDFLQSYQHQGHKYNFGSSKVSQTAATRSRHVSRSGSSDFTNFHLFSICLLTRAGDVDGAVMFDIKEEGERATWRSLIHSQKRICGVLIAADS